jgi:hypothetical protein
MPTVMLKRCTKCIMPETQQGIVLMKKVCGTYRQNEIRRGID